MTSTGLALSLVWRPVRPYCSITANKTGINVKKSERETSCVPELPMLLWTFGSIAAGSSEEKRKEEESVFSFNFQASKTNPAGLILRTELLQLCICLVTFIGILTCWEPVWRVMHPSRRKPDFSTIRDLSCVLCFGFVYMGLSNGAFMVDNIHFKP